MRQQYFLTLAKQASEKSDHYKYKMGCVIAKGNNVLGIGWNSLKTHPKSPDTHKSVHAEFMAVLDAKNKVHGATAYIFREQKDGTWAMAKPCECCWKYLMDCGIKEVVYSFEGTFRQEKLS